MNKRQLRQTARLFLLTAMLLTWANSAAAQVATGGSYALDQSVIASGGGASADAANNQFSLIGTIGQTAAGTRSINSPFIVTGGFWTAPPLGTTAAAVSISGRITVSRGIGLRNARVTLTNQSGESRTVLTGKLGYYRFAEVAAGETYIIQVFSKRYAFQPQVLTVTEEITELNFTVPAANVSGTLNTTQIPNLGASYIQNSPTQQTGNFNISGDGTVGGNLSANTVLISGNLRNQGLTRAGSETGSRDLSIIRGEIGEKK